jgi:hypothetical protein
MNNISTASILQELDEEAKEGRTKADAQRDELRTYLCNHMVTKVHISFSGSGDDGSIDLVDVTYADGHEPSDSVKEEVVEKLRDWTYVWLSGSNTDWVNNEGGQGEIEINLQNPPFTFTGYVDYNIQSSERGYDQEGIF